MTPLRQKLIDELDLRGLSLNTKDNYVGAVCRLARHFKKSPDRISDEELQKYLLYLIRDQQRSASTMSVVTSAFRFFYKHVLHRSTATVEEALPRVRKKTIRTRIYSPEEIERLLSVERLNPKHRAVLMTTYAAGLRVSEVCSLKVARTSPHWIFPVKALSKVFRGKFRDGLRQLYAERKLGFTATCNRARYPTPLSCWCD